jgi:arylformamidase
LKARVSVDDRELTVDLSRPVRLGVEIDFSEGGLRHFGAPAANSRPMAVGNFSGSVATGASCNCHTISLTPHCNGTHTESVGHLTREPLDAWRVVPSELLPALVCTIEALPASAANESTDPAPAAEDLLVTRGELDKAWTRLQPPFTPRAVVLRVQSQTPSRMPPYLSREAAEWLVSKNIEHLTIDQPSVDRLEDHGRLTAHRIFFGLPEGSTSLSQAKRSSATITELAHVPASLSDGWYFLQLQVPALGGDAVPSRPLVYPLA